MEVIGSNPIKEKKEGKSGKTSWKDDECGKSSKLGNGLFGGWKPNPKFHGRKENGLKKRRRLSARGSDRKENEEEEKEEEIDQRFYITGCNALKDISLTNLRSITADIMSIFDYLISRSTKFSAAESG